MCRKNCLFYTNIIDRHKNDYAYSAISEHIRSLIRKTLNKNANIKSSPKKNCGADLRSPLIIISIWTNVQRTSIPTLSKMNVCARLKFKHASINNTFINSHSPTEEKIDAVKDALYDHKQSL